MPRVVRNFWVEVDVDGYKHRITRGPRRKDGGFDIDVYMRSDGDIILPLRVTGWCNSEGMLYLEVTLNGQHHLCKTRR